MVYQNFGCWNIHISLKLVHQSFYKVNELNLSTKKQYKKILNSGSVIYFVKYIIKLNIEFFVNLSSLICLESVNLALTITVSAYRHCFVDINIVDTLFYCFSFVNINYMNIDEGLFCQVNLHASLVFSEKKLS